MAAKPRSVAKKPQLLTAEDYQERGERLICLISTVLDVVDLTNHIIIVKSRATSNAERDSDGFGFEEIDEVRD